jgi:DNA processing protein
VDPRWFLVLHAAESAPRPWVQALRGIGELDAVLALGRRGLAHFGVPADAASRLASPDPRVAASWDAWLAEPGHDLVFFGTEAYPKRLAEIPDPPLALWITGSKPDVLDCPQLAVVGSRAPTAGGVQTAKEFAAELSRRGLAVTSGLATGIDAAAHEGGLLGIGSTVAVLGCGIDRIYPRSNARLARAIEARGLIVSEYPPGTSPRPFHFPRRNRIIAGLSLGALIVEATRKSGSLITAKAAADCGREVFAIPGSISNPLAWGCHRLIGDGAKLVESVDDIVVELAAIIELPRVEPSESRSPTAIDDAAVEQRKFLKLLGFEPVSVSQLALRAGLTAAEVSSMLLLLEMEGKVEALPGGRYCRLVKRA